MNSNETYRDGASERAAELNQVYLEIIDEYNFTRFDMAYFDYPIFDVIEYWEVRPGHLPTFVWMCGENDFLHAKLSALWLAGTAGAGRCAARPDRSGRWVCDPAMVQP